MGATAEHQTRTAGDAPGYRVCGLTVSYFTRKVTGYLDHLDLGWRLDPLAGNNHPEALAAGWNGGIPVIESPDGELMWDSTSVLLHLDAHQPATRSILPDDPTLRFLAFLLDDFSDEWLYRHAVGTRWLYEENTAAGSWDITRDLSVRVPIPAAQIRTMVTAVMQSSLPRLGTSADNIDAWVHDSLLPWQRALAAHVTDHEFLFGRRPSLADFALFGGNAAHFVNDPVCRTLVDEHAPAVTAWTHRLMAFRPDTFGDWLSGDVPATLLALLRETGRHYLPWVAEATVAGEATVTFESGPTTTIATTPFLSEARGVLLARYRQARSDTLDAVLEEAGILRHFADHLDQATAIPDPVPAPRPTDNRPYPAEPPEG